MRAIHAISNRSLLTTDGFKNLYDYQEKYTFTLTKYDTN